MRTSLRNKIVGAFAATALVLATAGATPTVAAEFHGGSHGGGFHGGHGFAGGFHGGSHFGGRFAGNYGHYGHRGWGNGYAGYGGYYGGYYCNPAFIILNPQMCL